MSLLIRSVDGEPLIQGVAEHVEQFSTALLDAARHTRWLEVDRDRIIMRDRRHREIVYRITTWTSGPVDDATFVTAELISDTTPEAP